MARLLPWACAALIAACALPAAASAARYSTLITPNVTPDQWVAAHPDLTGDARPGATLARTDAQPAPSGGWVVRYQQQVAGIPVLGAETVIQTDRTGDAVFAQGERLTGPAPTGDPAITIGAARAIARAAVAKYTGASPWRLVMSDMSPVIVDPRIIGMPMPRAPYRAWQGEVTGPGIRKLVLVDDARGTVRIIERMPGALDRIICDAANADQFATCTPADAVRSEGDPATGITDVDLAYGFSGDWYDYFAALGRDSLDDAGMTLASTVRYCPAGEACPFQNAYWNGTQMTYGDGFASADDVVAHELTHGVIEKSANLLYYYQSGAINESMADVFGELVDLANGQGTDTPAVRWKVGEDLATLGVIRDMADPTVFGDPDSTQSPQWWTSGGDNGGVHVNSGVGNKAASLMADGGTHRGITVTGIGTEATGRIFYRALVAGLTSGSNYTDLAAALAASCDALVGTHGISAGDCIQARAAINAVAMDQAPATGSRTAPACPSGIAPAVVFADDMESTTAWQYSNPTVWGPTQGYATSGTWSMYGENMDVASDATATLTEIIAPTRRTWVHLRHAYSFESSDRNYDGGVIEYRTRAVGGAWGAWEDAEGLIDAGDTYPGTITGPDNALVGRRAFVGASQGYGSSRLNLAPLAGSEVQLRFRVVTDALIGDIGWVIDDLQVVTCPSADDTPPVTTIGDLAADINSATLTPTLGAGEPATFACSLDDAAYATCPARPTFGPLAEGTHTLRVRATDLAGNRETAPVTATVRIDLTPPESTITRADVSAVEFASTEASTFACRINGAPWEDCTSPYRVEGRLPGGPSLVMVRARDVAGNIDATPAEATITYVLAAPEPTPTPTPIRRTPDTQITSVRTTRTSATIRFADPTRVAVRFECRVDRGPWRSCRSPHRIRALAVGRHTIRVRGIGPTAMRDPSPATRTVRIRG